MAAFNYDLGSYANSTAALADIVAKGWDVAGDPVEGMFFYDTTLKRTKAWDGTSWNVTDYKGGTINVAKEGGDYTTLEEGLAAAALLSRSVILLSPGIYSENNPLTMPVHCCITVTGRHESTYVACQNAGAHGVVMATDTEVQGLQVRDASGAGSAGYHFPAGIHDAELHDCKFRDCDIGFLSEAAGLDAAIFIRQPHASGGSCSTAYKVQGGGQMFVEGAVHTDGVTCGTFVECDGLGSKAEFYVCRIQGSLTTRCGTISNDAELEMQITRITDASEGFFVEATGGALSLGSSQFTGVAGTQISLADAAGVYGFLNDIYYDDDLLVKGAAAFLSGIYEASDVSSRPGPTVVGELWLGTDPAEQIPLASYTRDTASSGWVSGLDVTDGGGLNVAVSSGKGMVNTGTGVVQVEYAGGTVAVTDDSQFWIFITSAGVLSQQHTEPDHATNIVLALGRAQGGAIVMLADHTVQMQHDIGRRHDYLADVIGSIWQSGLAVTCPGLLALDIAGGTYYHTDNLETTTGAAPATWTTWYNAGVGSWVATPGVANLDNAQYNNFGVGLAAIPTIPNEWVKPAIYVCVAGGVTQFHLVYPQASYASQALAEAAAFPTVPNTFDDAAMLLAGPVIQAGAATPASIIDARPVIQTGDVGSIVPVNDHNALINLASDDHTQYGLLSGNALRNPVTGEYDFAGGTLTVPTAAVPAQTKEGSVVWDSDDDLLTVGDGASRKTMADTNTAQVLTNKTLTTPTIADLTNVTHDHQDAAGGGVLAAPDITSFANAGHTHQDAAGGGVLAAPGITAFTNATHNHQDAAGGGTLNGIAVAQATTTDRGTAEIATQTEVNARADTVRYVTPATLAATPKAPPSYATYVHAEASGVNGGATPAVPAWIDRKINTTRTVVGTDISRAGSVITLATGTYRVSAYGTGYKCEEFQLRLRNTSDATTSLISNAPKAKDGATAILNGYLTVAGGPKTYQLQMYARSDDAEGMGRALSSGEGEVYAGITIERI